MAQSSFGSSLWEAVTQSEIAKIRDENRSRVRFFVSAIVFAAVGAALALASAGRENAGVVLMAGVGSAAIGAFFGFLFGIPRILQASPAVAASTPGKDSTEEPERVWASSNSNLERISDWLTAAIIGATLVQLQAISNGLDWLARMVASGMTLQSEGVLKPEVLPPGYAIAYFCILYFFVGGFLFAYLFTRLRLLTEFNSVERNLRNEIRKKEEVIDKQSAELENKKTEQDLMLNQWLNAVDSEAIHVQRLSSDDDANRGKFGGKAESSNRRLNAKVTPLKGKFCSVQLRVEASTSSAPLTSPVTFHLHETFKPYNVVTVNPVDNAAVFDIVAYGAFVVGAETDNGATKLELDLAGPSVDAPAEWKAR